MGGGGRLHTIELIKCTKSCQFTLMGHISVLRLQTNRAHEAKITEFDVHCYSSFVLHGWAVKFNVKKVS